jgi:lactoylglutathione lyase
MKISHIAIWVNDLEQMAAFYCHFFNGRAGAIYRNPAKGFESCFVSFDSGVSIELMRKTDQLLSGAGEAVRAGFHHLAFSVGSAAEVDRLTALIRDAGFGVKGNPRTTGDGYFESVILDPEGNIVEITV